MSQWKLVVHWTAGPYTMTSLDYEHYHFTVGRDGEIAHGKFKPEDNIPGPHGLQSGHYAAHCGNGNSWAIGVSLRGMGGYRGRSSIGKYPLTQKQCEAAWQFIAGLCKQYKIEVTPDTVETHYEFGMKMKKINPKSSSIGKIDINFLPFKPELKDHEVGDYIRNKVKWYLGKL